MLLPKPRRPMCGLHGLRVTQPSVSKREGGACSHCPQMLGGMCRLCRQANPLVFVHVDDDLAPGTSHCNALVCLKTCTHTSARTTLFAGDLCLLPKPPVQRRRSTGPLDPVVRRGPPRLTSSRPCVRPGPLAGPFAAAAAADTARCLPCVPVIVMRSQLLLKSASSTHHQHTSSPSYIYTHITHFSASVVATHTNSHLLSLDRRGGVSAHQARVAPFPRRIPSSSRTARPCAPPPYRRILLTRAGGHLPVPLSCTHTNPGPRLQSCQHLFSPPHLSRRSFRASEMEMEAVRPSTPASETASIAPAYHELDAIPVLPPPPAPFPLDYLRHERQDEEQGVNEEDAELEAEADHSDQATICLHDVSARPHTSPT